MRRSLMSGEPVEGCVFCNFDAIAGVATVVTAPVVVRFEPLNPVTPGHMLFVPEVHVENAATNPPVTAIVMRAAAEYAALRGVPFNLITSAGVDATQSVLHLNVHYVPRAEGDGLHLPWTGQAERERTMPKCAARGCGHPIHPGTAMTTRADGVYHQMCALFA